MHFLKLNRKPRSSLLWVQNLACCYSCVWEKSHIDFETRLAKYDLPTECWLNFFLLGIYKKKKFGP